MQTKPAPFAIDRPPRPNQRTNAIGVFADKPSRSQDGVALRADALKQARLHGLFAAVYETGQANADQAITRAWIGLDPIA